MEQAYNPSDSETEAGGSQVQNQPQQLSKALSTYARPCLQIKIKKGWGCDSVVKQPRGSKKKRKEKKERKKRKC